MEIVAQYSKHLKSMWKSKEIHHHLDRLEKVHHEYLSQNFHVPFLDDKKPTNTSEPAPEEAANEPTPGPSQPVKPRTRGARKSDAPFIEKVNDFRQFYDFLSFTAHYQATNSFLFFQSDTTKFRLAKDVRDCGHDPGAILLAASQVMRQDGHPDCATVIKTLQEKPDLGPKLKAAIDLDLGPKPKADHVKTLSLILCKEFSVEQYEEWRKNVNSTVGYSVYPCYKTLAKSKELLRPAVIITKVERFLIQEQI